VAPLRRSSNGSILAVINRYRAFATSGFFYVIFSKSKLDSSWTSSVFTPFSSSVDSRIDSKLDTSTFTSFSSSVSSEQITQDNKLNSLISATGSYARLDIDNNFSGSQIITGSVNGNVESLTVTSQTASIDCSQGNFFTLELPSGATHFEATNIVPGQTISLRLLRFAVVFL